MTEELCGPEKLRKIVAECNGTLGHHFWRGDLHFGVTEVEDPTPFQASKLERVFNTAYGDTHKVTVTVENGHFVAIFAPA